MRTVHKYVLTAGSNGVPTYEGAKFLHVANQREQITVWAEVNTLERECNRVLYIVGTGHVIPPNCDHIGSALVAGGDFVFHVYADRPATTHRPETTTDAREANPHG